MRKLILCLGFCLTWLPCMAQDQAYIDSLEVVAQNRNGELYQLWSQKAYPQALEVLRELAGMPHMNEVEDVWPSILYGMACAHSLLGNRGSTTGRMNWADRKYAIGRGGPACTGRRSTRCCGIPGRRVTG